MPLVDLARRARLRLSGVQRVRVGFLAAYERDGCVSGAPCRCVALVHGLGDSALTWDKVLLEAPRTGWRLLAVELPGSEGSDAPASYAVPDLAKTLNEALRPVCPEWTIVGNSLGGWVAAWQALDWPRGVRGLLLLNPAGFADPTGVEEATAHLLEAPTGAALRDFSKRAYHQPRLAPPWAWSQLAAGIRARPAAKMVAALRREDLLDGRAGAIRAKTTVLWGESDRVVPRAVGEAFAREIPGATLVPVSDCGHLPQQECPAAVTSALWPKP